jgi:putative membrane-bound dehydrogenase-like protein
MAPWMKRLLGSVLALSGLSPGQGAAAGEAPAALDQRPLVESELAASSERYTTAEAWDARREEIRTRFLFGAGLWPLPALPPPRPLLHGRREHQDYSVEELALETFPGFYLTANLYRPLALEKRAPGILSPHGHFKPDGRFMPDQQALCAHLARMGATVLSYGMVGWQDSRQTTHDDPLVLALQTLNSIRALDYLSGLETVDPAWIGITGASGGATQTIFLAMLDDRIRASAPVVIVYPWAAPSGCRCEGGLPVMQAAATNAIEIAAAAAPRPQLLVSVGGDETRDFPQSGFPFIRGVYQLHGRAELVENVHLADEAHDYGPSKRIAVYAFFAKHLGLRLLPEDLSRIAIEPPSLLSVFDESHPLPEGALRGSQEIARALAKLPRGPARPGQAANPGGRPPPLPECEPFLFTPPGFEKEGRTVAAGGKSSGRLSITVRDASTGLPTPCRMNVVGADGNFYQPGPSPLSPYSLTGQWPRPGSWGNRVGKGPYRYLGRFFYTRGQAVVEVEPGMARVEVWKGFEHRPEFVEARVESGKTEEIEIKLNRTASMAELGYYAGDPHLHLKRETQSDEETALDLLEAEDVRYGALLAYNEPPGPYAGFMDRMVAPQRRGLGAGSARQRGVTWILSGQEYRSTAYGHLLLYLKDKLVLEGQTLDADQGPLYGELAREVRAAGGQAIHAHGGYGQEIYADLVHGAISAVELLQFAVYRGIGLEDWYHLLNFGYRLPVTGASDYPACRALSDCRTYVHQETVPTMAEWLRGAAEGRSFVTTGPLLLLEIDEVKPGATIKTKGPGPFRARARARVRSEVTGIQELSLILNGEVVASARAAPGQGRGGWFEIQRPLDLTRSSWIAARATGFTPGGRPDAEAHTNPIYVEIEGRACYRRESLDVWVDRIDRQIAVQTARNFAGKPRVLAYFQEARDLLLRIREAGGLPAGPDPAAEARRLLPAGTTGLELDGSLRNPTDQELRDFLRPIPPRRPEEQSKSLETADGFRLELVAAEPLVYNPVAGAFDEDGNLYVAEMRDYPYRPPPGQKPLGSVRFLRDTDGDGRFDEGHLFAEGLLWTTGIACWKGGVFVASPPDIWYLKDTDGDFTADLRRRVYTGFGLQSQQHMLNNLQLWLDGKIYGATAGNGGIIRAVDHPDLPEVPVNGRDFRFDPESDLFESITGTMQFGNTFDDWGNRFVCSESHPLLHVVLPQRYLERNPHLPVPQAIQDCAPAPVPVHRISPVERWRHIRSSRRIAQNERPAEAAGSSHHVVDAGSGVTVYRGGAYPARYYGTVFTADGQNNLIHHRLLVPDGVSFRSRRAEEKTEFVRSSDLWFRPVNLLNAPDGTLYCLDMSREVLESIHIPLDVVKHLDLTSGRDYGRIYRIAPPGFRSPPPPRLSGASTEELAALLESPHGWRRDTGCRLLLERKDRSAATSLRRLLTASALPQARLCALWTLEGLGALEEEPLAGRFADEAPGVRENAVLLAERRLERSPRLLEGVLALAADPDPRVRFQVAFTLGETRDPRAVRALGELARSQGSDPWMRTAILSSLGDSSDRVLASLLQDPRFDARGPALEMVEPLALVAGVRNRREEVERVLDALAARTPAAADGLLRARLLRGLGAGLERAGGRLPVASRPATPRERLVLELVEGALRTVAGTSAADPEREEAVAFLGCVDFARTREPLAALLDPRQPPSLQAAAVRALSGYSEPEVAALLLAGWSRYPPAVHQEVVQALLEREDRTLSFLRSAEAGEASAAQVDPARRALLLNHRSGEIRSLAGRLFGKEALSPRAAVIAQYRSALKLQPDPSKGELVFNKICQGCHQLGNKGHAVGPNLASAPARDSEDLLTQILDPNQYVPPNYVQYVARDRRGRTVVGMIAAQTAAGVTLKREEGRSETFLRADLVELTSTGLSLMPEGLEKNISLREMADLIGFLKAARSAEGANRSADPTRDFGTLPGLAEPGKR